MFSLLTVASAILATALPTASAGRKPPSKTPSCTDIIIKELYRKPLPTENEFYNSGSVDAEGKNTGTAAEAYLFQDGGNEYSAFFVGTADRGSVVIFNEGYASTLDCDKVKTLVITKYPVKYQLCLKKAIVLESKVCSKATAYFAAEGFAFGKDATVVVTSDTITTGGASGTFQTVGAQGSQGAGAALNQQNTLEGKDGSVNTAGASTTVLASGKANIETTQGTFVDDKSSSSNISINASSKAQPDKKGL